MVDPRSLGTEPGQSHPWDCTWGPVVGAWVLDAVSHPASGVVSDTRSFDEVPPVGLLPAWGPWWASG